MLDALRASYASYATCGASQYTFDTNELLRIAGFGKVSTTHDFVVRESLKQVPLVLGTRVLIGALVPSGAIVMHKYKYYSVQSTRVQLTRAPSFEGHSMLFYSTGTDDHAPPPAACAVQPLLHIMFQNRAFRVWLFGLREDDLAGLGYATQQPATSACAVLRDVVHGVWRGSFRVDRQNIDTLKPTPEVEATRVFLDELQSFLRRLEDAPDVVAILRLLNNAFRPFGKRLALKAVKNKLQCVDWSERIDVYAERIGTVKNMRDLYTVLTQAENALDDTYISHPRECVDFLRVVRTYLNSPEMLDFWHPAPVKEIRTWPRNTLRYAAMMCGRRLTYPIPHVVFKTWVKLQRKYGPSDDMPAPEAFNLVLNTSRLAVQKGLHLGLPHAVLQQALRNPFAKNHIATLYTRKKHT
jgi:hypothetical protein